MISRIALVFSFLAQLPSPLAAQPAPVAKPSLQTLFDTATDAWQANDCAKALPIFAQLAEDPRIQPGSLPSAAIAVRRGDCMIVSEHTAQGEALIAQGLPILRQAGAEFSHEVIRAEQRLGRLADLRWDHDTALGHYRAALALLKGSERLQTLMWLAQLTAFDNDHQALDAVEEGLALASASPTSPNAAAIRQAKQQQALWYMMRGRILMNRGQVKEARKALEYALYLSGGQKAQISAEDALLRADLAQVAMLNNDPGKAYGYMAETGAGRLEHSMFSKDVRISPPQCGPDTGLEPEDRAVVEFSINDRGEIIGAQTVYSNGSYAKAAAFAKAVQTWAWPSEAAAKIPAFFRVATRVEMVCTRAEGQGGVSPVGPLKARFSEWAPLAAEGNDAWPHWLAAAEAAKAAGKDDVELAARVRLASVDLRGLPERLASMDRAEAIARSASPRIPPEAARSALVLLESARPTAKTRHGDDEESAMDRRLALADDPLLANDAIAQDTALLIGAPRKPRTDQAGRIHAILMRVAQDQRLPAHHPLRQFAQLRLANDAARAGDLAAAEKWFNDTGLTQEQCALIGPRPALSNANNSADNFPGEALRYGFEGWTRTEFDIQADGRTAQVRTVIAYPPFIFTDAARKILNGARYQASYRPERGAACSASSESVTFSIPGNRDTVELVKAKR